MKSPAGVKRQLFFFLPFFIERINGITMYIWMLGEECKPIIVCNANKPFHFPFPGMVTELTIVNGDLTAFR
ncbi:MAG: hypothetical protein ACQEQO_07495 [Thermodesulfobacteriota bacterium]